MNRSNRLIKAGIKSQVINEEGLPHLWLTFANIPVSEEIFPQCDIAPFLFQTFKEEIFPYFI
jgi:hypothetical protein